MRLSLFALQRRGEYRTQEILQTAKSPMGLIPERLALEDLDICARGRNYWQKKKGQKIDACTVTNTNTSVKCR